MRKISIDAVLSDSSVCSLGDDIYEKYLEVQQPFFDFIQKFEGEFSYPQKPQIDKQRLVDYKWNTDKYTVKRETEWIEFVRNRHLLRGQFELNSEFNKNLKSLNTLPITHSRRRNLQIDDLFIAPRLQIYSFENIIDGKPTKETIERGNCF